MELRGSNTSTLLTPTLTHQTLSIPPPQTSSDANLDSEGLIVSANCTCKLHRPSPVYFPASPAIAFARRLSPCVYSSPGPRAFLLGGRPPSFSVFFFEKRQVVGAEPQTPPIRRRVAGPPPPPPCPSYRTLVTGRVRSRSVRKAPATERPKRLVIWEFPSSPC